MYKADLPKAIRGIISKDTTYIAKFRGCVERYQGGEASATCAVYHSLVGQAIAAVGGNKSDIKAFQKFPKCKFLNQGTLHIIGYLNFLNDKSGPCFEKNDKVLI